MPDKNEQHDSKVTDAQPQELRHGGANGARKNHRENYNGHEPLEYPAYEALAQHLTTAKSLREFKSDNDLAEHFHVQRMTVFRWKKDPDVILRVNWLATCNRLAGDLVVLREWAEIVETATEMAKGGNIGAMNFCAAIACREDRRREKSALSPLSLEEVLERTRKEHIKHSEMMTPTWLKERAKRLAKGPVPSAMALMEQEAEPEAGDVNTCEAKGELP